MWSFFICRKTTSMFIFSSSSLNFHGTRTKLEFSYLSLIRTLSSRTMPCFAVNSFKHSEKQLDFDVKSVSLCHRVEATISTPSLYKSWESYWRCSKYKYNNDRKFPLTSSLLPCLHYGVSDRFLLFTLSALSCIRLTRFVLKYKRWLWPKKWIWSSASTFAAVKAVPSTNVR